MKPLFESKHFCLNEIRRSGKKAIAGTLFFQGMQSDAGDFRRILAVKAGKVTFAGRATKGRTRRYGIHVCVEIADIDGPITMTYYGLDARIPHVGEDIMPGDTIGFSSSGILGIETRRNGRLIDAPAVLGIPPFLQVWDMTDIVRVVRCADCKESRELRRNDPTEDRYVEGCLWCMGHGHGVLPTQFCAEGDKEKKQ